MSFRHRTTGKFDDACFGTSIEYTPCIIRINITLKLSYCINTTFKILFHGIGYCCQTYTI